MIFRRKLIQERLNIYFKPLVLYPAGVKGEATCRTLGLPIEELRQSGIFVPTCEDVTVTQRTLRRQQFHARVNIFRCHVRTTVALKVNLHIRFPVSVCRYTRVIVLAPFPVVQLQVIITGMPFVPTCHGVVIDIDQLLRLCPFGTVGYTDHTVTQIFYFSFLFVGKEVLAVLETTERTVIAIIHTTGKEEVDQGISSPRVETSIYSVHVRANTRITTGEFSRRRAVEYKTLPGLIA